MKLANKVALVTGSARGIGRAIALALAEAGADVAVHYYGDQEQQAQEVAGQIAARGRRTVVVEGDVSDRDAVQRMVRRAGETLGAIDILVNNAATFLDGVALWETTETQWDRVFAVNVKGPLWTVQAVLPAMQSRRSGVILNISSLGADVAMSGFAAYISSKAALNGLTRAMSLELAPWNIRVNALAPGHVDTPETVAWVTEDAAREQRFRTRIALGRLGTTDEMARTALFLVSDDASYITGQVIHAEGGLMMWQGILT